MSRANSPGYPNFGLPRALHHARAIFNNAGRKPIDRLVAARHMGYMGKSGASDKALGSLAHFGLIEGVGKGEIRVTRTALDILHPDKPTDRKRALVKAAFRPSIFMELRKRFPKRHMSVEAIQSYLKRENFLDRAIRPLTSAYIETVHFLEQESATISDG